MAKHKVYVEGKDGIGWSIDGDRNGVVGALNRLGIHSTNNLPSASLVHNLWWNALRRRWLLKLLRKKILVTCSNFVDLDNPNYALRSKFEEIAAMATAWIAPSQKQKEILEKHGHRTFYLPFYLNLNVFTQVDQDREQICKEIGIDPAHFADKVILGSFMRDSTGGDLMKPKWQKNPDLLIELCDSLPKDKFILFITGPRRHYVIHHCKEKKIPYYYHGSETDQDDLLINKVDNELMPLLYSLCDIQLVTSVSEGGPKAIMEGTACNRLVLSTDVGIAGDFLEPINVCRDRAAYIHRLNELVSDPAAFRYSREHDGKIQHDRAHAILSPAAMDSRLKDIYEAI